jgi:hypothetical protein
MVDPSGRFGGMVGLGMSMAIGGNMRGMSMGSVVVANNFFNNVLLPVLQLPHLAILTMQELSNFTTTITNFLSTIHIRAQREARVKYKFNDNFDIVVTLSGRCEFENDPLTGISFNLASSINMTSTIKMPWIMDIFPWTRNMVKVAEKANIKLLPTFVLTIRGIKASTNDGVQTFEDWWWRDLSWSGGLRASGTFFGSKGFAELGISGKFIQPSFRNWEQLKGYLVSTLKTIGITGRIVTETTDKYPEGYINPNTESVKRTTHFRFKIGGTYDDADT